MMILDQEQCHFLIHINLVLPTVPQNLDANTVHDLLSVLRNIAMILYILVHLSP